MSALLEVRGLEASIRSRDGEVHAVRGVDLSLDAGETLALVGESGCGKSMTAQSLVGLLPPGTRLRGSVRWRGRELLGLPEAQLRRLRGRDIGFVFQSPMTAFNPTLTVGEQIAEVLRAHRNMGRAAARQRSIELLERMQVPAPERRARQYPFEFSGGMLQRAMVAMAMACGPRLLIADEPTTALDVTVQAQVLALLEDLRREQGMALLLITHDLAVVAQMADRVAVMYAGQVVEQAPVRSLFHAGAHPYTEGLKQAIPERAARSGVLHAIPGTPPDLISPPAGCGFYARCPRAMRLCEHGAVPFFEVADDHTSRCWLRHPEYPGRTSGGTVPEQSRD